MSARWRVAGLIEAALVMAVGIFLATALPASDQALGWGMVGLGLLVAMAALAWGGTSVSLDSQEQPGGNSDGQVALAAGPASASGLPARDGDDGLWIDHELDRIRWRYRSAVLGEQVRHLKSRMLPDAVSPRVGRRVAELSLLAAGYAKKGEAAGGTAGGDTVKLEVSRDELDIRIGDLEQEVAELLQEALLWKDAEAGSRGDPVTVERFRGAELARIRDRLEDVAILLDGYRSQRERMTGDVL
ncbi:MAG: hypothetical protein M0Z53_16215 [Thermaerobacter sp.]|nr:hypothetical protein [Thermaerobacter sp.]